MSADNGVFILETYGPEFRVAYLHNIDAIYGKFNDDTNHWDGDAEMIQQYFGNAPVFDDLDLAVDKAQEISDNYDYLEYGICVISDFKKMLFIPDSEVEKIKD